MTILVISNRKLNSKHSDHRLFGDDVNVSGPSNIRLAHAQKNGSKWRVSLVSEPRGMKVDNMPSQKVIPTYISELKAQNKNCVFYVHGFNKTFKNSLNQAQSIANRYNVGVILFSWPSNPGGLILSEYKKSQAIASNSIIALDRSLDKLNQCTKEYADRADLKITSVFHSLGSFMFEQFIRNPIFTGETRIFDANILHASDVDLDEHKVWANKLVYAPHTYALINERDLILNVSDIINPDRLGNTAHQLDSDRVTYINLTGGKGIGARHQHFEASAGKNEFVEKVFMDIFNSFKPLRFDGFIFNQQLNAFELID